jgi:hypothetical protein
MIQKLLEVINSATSYEATFEESHMMNVAVDSIKRNLPFAYIEEYRSGKYSSKGFVKDKTTKIEIYFCRFAALDSTALQREEIRKQIEMDALEPFMEAYNNSGYFKQVYEFDFFTPIPRFDANEVSVRLSFDCIIDRC